MKNKLGSFVIADSSKCTGCRACEVACFTTHNQKVTLLAILLVL